MPPRPGAVAIATMVSEVLNTAIAANRRKTASAYFGEMTTVLRNASPMLSDVTAASSDTAR